MFSFFVSRNRFSFKDIGLKCDIHSHILPGVDDGAGDVESSCGILRALIGCGVERVVLTPHVSGGLYPNSTSQLRAGFDRLNAAIDPDIKDRVALRLGAEYMIDEDFPAIDDKLVYNDNHILVEMSYSQRSINLLDAVFQLVEDGYDPILAHPERYVFYFGAGKPSCLGEIEKLLDMGCSMQLNVLSLTGAYGSASLDNVKYFLDHDWYSYVATDIHSLSQLGRFGEFRVNAAQFEKVRLLAHNNEQLF